MQGILNLVWDHMLASMHNDALPADEASLIELKNKLESLRLSTVRGTETSEFSDKVSDRKIILEDNLQGIEALMLDIDGSEKTLTFWTDQGEQKIPVGFEEMLKGEMVMNGIGTVAIASSGAWIDDDTYQVEMYNYESLHAVTYNFNFEEDSVNIDSEFNVFFGDRKQPRMQGKLELLKF